MTPSRPSTPSPDPARQPSGRLRLAAALSGAGVLAVGMGAGVMQSTADDAAVGTPDAPGAGVLGARDSSTVQPSATSSTPVSPGGTTGATPLGGTSTDPAPPADTTTAPADPAPEQAESPAPAPETTPPLADPAPAPAPAPETPAAPTQAEAPPAPAAPKDEPDDFEYCAPDEDLAISAAAELDREVTGDDSEDCVVPAPEKRKTKKRLAHRPTPPAQHTPDGRPTIANPTISLATPGAAPIGVPNFFIDKFRIPPFLLPIYQAAGMEYGVRWEILAAINEIETDYGRNTNVSSAGALGWMQFMPATWRQYGVDANGDGRRDPYNPVDAIFSAARYLKAAGAEHDLRRAIFAYNHADWYVDSVLMRARLVGGLPSDLVGSLTGLTQGRFPLAGKARYADDLDQQRATQPVARGASASVPVEGDADRRAIKLFGKAGTAAVATHDGVVVRRGTTRRLGRFVQVRDPYGNTYTYARLKSLEASHPVPKRRAQRETRASVAETAPAVEPKVGEPTAEKERLFASPRRPQAFVAGGRSQVGGTTAGRAGYVRELLNLSPRQVTWKDLRPGSRVVAGTVLGRIGKTTSPRAPYMLFEVRPAGRGAPRVDPKPILDGWKLLESTAIYRANGRNPFFGRDAKTPSIGQILLMSKEMLQRRVLANPHVTVYDGGRNDIRTGAIDRRVLALLEFLAANGLEPTVTSLMTGHGVYTSSGNVSHHTTGTAVDIAAINGIPMVGHQGEGSITDIAIRRMLTLQGAMKPDQIISLMTYEGATNTLAMGDHGDHIHVGYRPIAGSSRGGLNAVLKPGQWHRVIGRLNAIKNPKVSTKPSKASIRVRPKRRAGAASRARPARD